MHCHSRMCRTELPIFCLLESESQGRRVQKQDTVISGLLSSECLPPSRPCDSVSTSVSNAFTLQTHQWINPVISYLPKTPALNTDCCLGNQTFGAWTLPGGVPDPNQNTSFCIVWSLLSLLTKILQKSHYLSNTKKLYNTISCETKYYDAFKLLPDNFILK